MNRGYSFLVLVILCGCYGINEKTSEIGILNTDCIPESSWNEIVDKYSPDNIQDSLILEKVDDFKNLPFSVVVLCLQDDPKELIAVSENLYFVRYVFNPAISSQIEHGMSPELSEAEKKRIRNRVQRLLLPYQCSEGRKKALEMMSE